MKTKDATITRTGPAPLPTPGPGPVVCGWELDLTDSEAAMIETLRDCQKAEKNWDAYFERDAWQMLRYVIADVRRGETPEYIATHYGDEDHSLLYPAALAVIAAVDALKERLAQNEREMIKLHGVDYRTRKAR